MNQNLDVAQQSWLVIVRVENIWRGIWRVTYRLKGPRHYQELFRKVCGEWCCGEAHPTGVYSSPMRLACPAMVEALDKITSPSPANALDGAS